MLFLSSSQQGSIQRQQFLITCKETRDHFKLVTNQIKNLYSSFQTLSIFDQSEVRYTIKNDPIFKNWPQEVNDICSYLFDLTSSPATTGSDFSFINHFSSSFSSPISSIIPSS